MPPRRSRARNPSSLQPPRCRCYEKGPSARSRCVPSGGGGAAGERIIFRENLSAAAPFAVCAALFLCVATPPLPRWLTESGVEQLLSAAAAVAETAKSSYGGAAAAEAPLRRNRRELRVTGGGGCRYVRTWPLHASLRHDRRPNSQPACTILRSEIRSVLRIFCSTPSVHRKKISPVLLV